MLDAKREREVKNLWIFPKSVAVFTIILSVCAVFSGMYWHALLLLCATAMVIYGVARELATPVKIYRQGEVYKAKIIKRIPKSGSAFASYKTKFTVSFANAKGEEILSDFTQYSENFFPIYRKKKYSLPKEGDEIFIYYHALYPGICCPDTSQFFKLGE